MSDVFRLPYNLPQNSHDWEEGTTSTPEWNGMTNSQYEFRDKIVDPSTGTVIQEAGYYPIDASYEQAQAQQYQNLTHQGRIRICNNFNGFEEWLDPKTVYNGRGFKTPSYNTTGYLAIVPDNHEYAVANNTVVVRMRDSAKGKPTSEFMPLASGDIGEVAYKAMVGYLGFLSGATGEAFATSGAEKTTDGVVLDDSTDVKPEAEAIFRRQLVDAKTAGKDTVEFDFSSALESIYGKSTLQECFFGMTRYGYFKSASKVDIPNLKITFSIKAAEDFLFQLFGQKAMEAYMARGTGLENVGDYTGPTSASVQYYYYGGSPKTYDDDVMESMAVYRGRENAFTTPIEKTYDYATAAADQDMAFGKVEDKYKQHTLYLPVLYNIKSKRVEVVTGPVYPDGVVDPAWFQNNSTVTNGFNLPPGYRLPSEIELVRFRQMSESTPVATPEDANYADDKITIVNDENMFVLNTTAHGNVMPLLAVAQFYQPLTNEQLAPQSDNPDAKKEYPSYNDVDSWMTDNIWMTYDEAFALATLTDQAPGVAMTMRRRSDLGFRYEYSSFHDEPIGNISDIPSPIGFPFFDANLPGGAIDAATDFDVPGINIGPRREKAACYAVKYAAGTFTGAYKVLDGLLDNTKGDVITLPNGMTISRDEAEELLHALANADRGIMETIVKFMRSNKWMQTFITVLVTLIGAGASVYGFYRMQKKMERNPVTPAKAEEIVADMTDDKVAEAKALVKSGKMNGPDGQYAPLFVGRKNEMLEVLQYMLGVIKSQQEGREQPGSMQITAPAGQGKTQFMNQISLVLARGFLPPSADDVGTAAWPSGEALSKYFNAEELAALGKIRILSLTMDAIKSGTKFSGTFEEKLEALEVLAKHDPYIFFSVDELADQVEAGSDMNDSASTLTKLKSVLSSSLKMITTLTPESLRKMAEKIKDGNQIMGRFNKVPAAGLGEAKEEDVALSLYLQMRSNFDVLRARGIDLSQVDLSPADLVKMCRGGLDNFFRNFIDQMREEGLSGGVPRMTAVRMTQYIADCLGRAAKGAQFVISPEDFARFYATRSDTDTQALRERFQGAVKSLVYEKMKFKPAEIQAIITKNGWPLSMTDLLQAVIKKGDDEPDAVYHFRMEEVVRRLEALITQFENRKRVTSAKAIQAQREEFLTKFYKTLQGSLAGIESENESGLSDALDEQAVTDQLLVNFDAQFLAGNVNAELIYNAYKDKSDQIATAIKTHLAVIFSPIPGEPVADRARRVAEAEDLCNQFVRSMGRATDDDAKLRIIEDFVDKLNPLTSQALRIRQALAAAPSPSPAAAPSGFPPSPAPGIPPGGLLAIPVNPGETAQAAGQRVVGSTFLALSHAYGLVNDPRTYADTSALLDAWFKKITELYNQANPTRRITTKQLMAAYDDIFAKEDSEDDAAYLLRMRNFVNDLIAIQQDTDITTAKADPVKLQRVAILMEQAIDKHYGIKAATAPSIQMRTHQKHRQAVLAYVDVVMNKLQLIDPASRPTPDDSLFADLAEALANEYNARHAGQPQITRDRMVNLLQEMFHQGNRAFDTESPQAYEQRLDAMITDFQAAIVAANTPRDPAAITALLNTIQKHFSLSPYSSYAGVPIMQVSTPTAAPAPAPAAPAPAPAAPAPAPAAPAPVTPTAPTDAESRAKAGELKARLDTVLRDATLSSIFGSDIKADVDAILNKVNLRAPQQDSDWPDRLKYFESVIADAERVLAGTGTSLEKSDQIKVLISEGLKEALQNHPTRKPKDSPFLQAYEQGKALQAAVRNSAAPSWRGDPYTFIQYYYQNAGLTYTQEVKNALDEVLKQNPAMEDATQFQARLLEFSKTLRQIYFNADRGDSNQEVLQKGLRLGMIKSLRAKYGDDYVTQARAAGVFDFIAKDVPADDLTPKAAATKPAAVTIAEDLAQFYTTNTDAKVVRAQAQTQYETLRMAHKIGTPSADPKAALLFAQVETTYNKIKADVKLTSLNINEYAFKLMALQAYAQYMNDTQFLAKGDADQLAQAQSDFAKTLRKQAGQFATAKTPADVTGATTEFNSNLTTFANILAENMVTLSRQARSHK